MKVLHYIIIILIIIIICFKTTLQIRCLTVTIKVRKYTENETYTLAFRIVAFSLSVKLHPTKKNGQTFVSFCSLEMEFDTYWKLLDNFPTNQLAIS